MLYTRQKHIESLLDFRASSNPRAPPWLKTQSRQVFRRRSRPHRLSWLGPGE
jgi:hypothetical protein